MNANNPETDLRRDRVAIWSVAEEYHNAFSIMLLAFWLVGMAAYAAYRLATYSDSGGALATIIRLIQDIGIVGLSSAILSIMVIAIIAGGKAAMVLFDWPTRKKVHAKIRREAQAQGQAEERAAWTDWLRRRDEAHARGEDFNEPSPAERNGDLS